MIAYSMPQGVSIAIAVMVMLTSMMQLLIALQAREAVTGGVYSHAFRALYLAQFAASFAVLLEMAFVISSTEEGLLLPVCTYGRYLSLLPVLAVGCLHAKHAPLPKEIRPFLVSCLVALLRLPLLDGLPWPVPQAAHLFAAVWLLADGALSAMHLYRQAKAQVTMGALRHVIGNIGQGVAVIGRGGWFVERNRAFDELYPQMGITGPLDRIDDLESAINSLTDAGRIRLAGVDGGQLIRAGDRSFLLRKDRFQHGAAVFRQLTLSDVSAADQASLALERRNEGLAEANAQLERSIAAIEQEMETRERNLLSRAAHDEWAQKLAIAGLSVDFLINSGGESLAGGMSAGEVAGYLKPTENDGCQLNHLEALLPAMAETYAGLGVEILVEGRAVFTPAQHIVLCAVLREAAANAVRHAYARQIHVTMWEEDASACLAITSACVDDHPYFAEGRGIHDMRQRTQQAGGAITIAKGDRFRVEVRFPACSSASKEGVS